MSSSEGNLQEAREATMSKSKFFISVALVMVFASATTHFARADAKDNFKQGCAAGNGSYLENADGSVQCNSSGGVFIRCDKEITKCSIVASIVKDISPSMGKLRKYMTRPLEVPGWKINPVKVDR